MRDDGIAAGKTFGDILSLCAVKPGETVAVLAVEGRLQGRAEAFLAVAQTLGANTYIVTIPAIDGVRGTMSIGRTALATQPNLVALLAQADLIVDLALLLFSAEQNDLLAAGVRIITCVEPLPVVQRLFPDPELRRDVEEAAELLWNAAELRVTCGWGTDLVYDLTDHLGGFAEYGIADRPGRWDAVPSGFVSVHPLAPGINGVIVLKPNDMLLFPVPHTIREPIKLTIQAGYITEIEGDSLDASLLREFFPDPANDREALAVSHIGWGLNRNARWEVVPDPLALQMDFRAYRGCVLFSTGPDTSVGGTRATPYHLDIPLRDCSLSVDGTPIVDAGKLVQDVPPVASAN